MYSFLHISIKPHHTIIFLYNNFSMRGFISIAISEKVNSSSLLNHKIFGVTIFLSISASYNVYVCIDTHLLFNFSLSELKNLSKMFAYQQIAKDIDNCDDRDMLKNIAKSFAKLY